MALDADDLRTVGNCMFDLENLLKSHGLQLNNRLNVWHDGDLLGAIDTIGSPFTFTQATE